MTTNKKLDTSKVIFPELSYTITGILFSVHNELGQYAREKQYGDLLGKYLKEINMPYKRELQIGGTGNVLDFVLDDKIVLELKATRTLVNEHFRQIQNYLQQGDYKLGLLINFRQRFLRPARVVKIDR